MFIQYALLTLAVLGTIIPSACQPATSIANTPPSSPATLASGTTTETPNSNQNRIAASIDISAPSNMTVGDGRLWVIAGGSIIGIDPKTNQLIGESIGAGSRPEDLAFGDGALWVTNVAPGDLGAPSETDAVSRIDPETGEVLSTVKVPRAPVSLAFTPEAVWVVNFGMGGDSVIRIDPKTGEILGEPIQTASAPISVALGDEALWVANHDGHTVTRIDLATNEVITNITVPSEPHRVAFGEGAVWVANWHVNSVTRIDPHTNQVVGEPIPIGFPAGNMVAGLGSVWVTSDYRGPMDGSPEDIVLVRINPQTNQVVETISLGGHPIDVEIAEGAVWVSIQGPNRVLRINP